MNKPKLHVVSFSGGKDSTAMLLRMLEEGMSVDLILYCETGLEFPEMGAHIRKVEEYIGRKITVIKSEKNFMYLATKKPIVSRGTINVSGINPGDIIYGYGWPSARVRWCTSYLKTDVINRYLKNIGENYDVIQYVGIAADELKRVRADKRYPLIDWGMTEKDCLQYCYDRGLDFGGLYEIWDRVSCWCCPLQSLDDLKKLKNYKPDLWFKLKEINEAMSVTIRPNFRYDVGLTDIDRRFKVEDEFIAKGKKIRTKEFYQTLKDRGINY